MYSNSAAYPKKRGEGGAGHLQPRVWPVCFASRFPETPLMPELGSVRPSDGLWVCLSRSAFPQFLRLTGSLSSLPPRLTPVVPPSLFVRRLLARVPEPGRVPAEDAGGVRSRLP